MSAEPPCVTAQPTDDLTVVKQTPLARRGLAFPTCGVVLRAGRLWPERTAVQRLATTFSVNDEIDEQ